MADNNKAYNFSVRDDTSFRVESGGSDITVRNMMSSPVVLMSVYDDGTSITTQPLQNMAEIVITGDVKTLVLRNQSV